MKEQGLQNIKLVEIIPRGSSVPIFQCRYEIADISKIESTDVFVFYSYVLKLQQNIHIYLLRITNTWTFGQSLWLKRSSVRRTKGASAAAGRGLVDDELSECITLTFLTIDRSNRL